MLVEYRKCRGWGWLLYDSAFRQQITDLESAKVNLYATTFLAYGGKGKFCSRCMASDHSQEDCALHPRHQEEKGPARCMLMEGDHFLTVVLTTCAQCVEAITGNRCAIHVAWSVSGQTGTCQAQ